MKLLPEFVPQAYDISKRVYEKQLTFSEGQKTLAGDDRMNKNSAADYMNNFRYLLEGKRFTRTLNAFSMDYFIANIHKDYGIHGLRNALTALKAHIEYYEGIQNVKMRKMRQIYEENTTKIVELFSPDELEQEEIIEEILKDKPSKLDILNVLKNLKETEPEVVSFKGKAFKRDNKTIALIKILRGFRCQLCGTTIRKKDGSCYIEAAHILPKYLKGRETLDNIILLCPNHHKEFDFGEPAIIDHTLASISFTLNGATYSVDFEMIVQ